LKEKLRLEQEEKEKHEKDKEMYQAKKQQDFEDLLSGKKKSTDDMSLQDLFKEFY
jgi:hypothetical protein